MPKPGSRQARGYGQDHVNARARAQKLVDQGQAACSRCGAPITPGTPWDLDHAEDRATYLGPAHRRCNRRAGGKKRQRLRKRRIPNVSRTWT